MCSGNPVDDVRELQDQIDDGVNRVKTLELLGQMVDKASSSESEELVASFLEGIFLGILGVDGREDDEKAIKLNILLILASPDKYLSVTQLVKEIKNIDGVTVADLGILLNKIRENLESNSELPKNSYSPIVELCEQYK
jgi:hypothetical protein